MLFENYNSIISFAKLTWVVIAIHTLYVTYQINWNAIDASNIQPHRFINERKESGDWIYPIRLYISLIAIAGIENWKVQNISI